MPIPAQLVRAATLIVLLIPGGPGTTGASPGVRPSGAGSSHPVSAAATCRCLTPTAARTYQGESVAPPCADLRRDWLHPTPLGDPVSAYVSPLGRFSLHFVTTGPDSVPDEDIAPANGVPDFIEHCADYADHVWTTEVDSLAFAAPEPSLDGTYHLTFLALPGGTYGYTTVIGPTTEIVLHRNFVSGVGWPGPNDDPDGDQLGRAKVTIAHEFKHASQFANDGWTEGTWVELDAMWMEEIVYPFVNEYRYWVDNNSFSQLDAPWVRIDNGEPGQGNYEDCLWQHWMSGRWGATCIREFWDRRALVPTEPVVDSYADVLAGYGTGWPRAYAGYMEWCWFTGARAEPGIGFPDAAELWKMELVEPATATYPYSVLASVDRLACHPRRFNPGAAAGRPRILFDGDDSASGLVVSVIVGRNDGSASVERLVLDGGNAGETLRPESWADLRYVGVLVTHGNPGGSAALYALDVVEDIGRAVEDARPLASAPAELSVRPNPSSAAVTLTVTRPAPGPASLRILDVSGRTVRRLPAPISRGVTAVTWDGRDDLGRPRAAGVYWASFESEGTHLTTKVVRVQ